MEQCIAVKNKVSIYERCPHKALENSEFCKKHSKKTSTVYDPNVLNPLNSENEVDIVSLEKITITKNGVKVLANEIKPNHLFTYLITVNGKVFQRTLSILTIKRLIETSYLIEPFSQVPFPEQVIQRAKEMLLKLKFPNINKTIKEKINVNINRLITKFQEIGYYINIDILAKMKKREFISWYYEFKDFYWKEFRNFNIDVALIIYPQLDIPNIELSILAITDLMVELVSNSLQGVQLVLQSLAQVNKKIKELYSDLI